MSTQLVDMRRSESEQEETSPIASVEVGEYDYGLRLHLDEAALKKLALSTPKVGAKMSIVAKGIVVSVSANRNKKKTDRHVEIQIQKLAIDEGAASMEDAVSDGIEDADE